MSRKTRTVAIGDPQTTAEHFFAVLDHHELLAADRNLRPEVRLVSVGDHFDFAYAHRNATLEDAQRDGVRILEWLATHSRDQVAILLGNHDVSRVTELHRVSDERFAEARSVCAKAAPTTSEWIARFPELPSPGLVHRDYSSFTEGQRRLVRRLLLEGRFSLAVTAQLGGQSVLLTHAGVTTRQLETLGIPIDSRALTIATTLERFLAAAIERVRPSWSSGRDEELDLSPLHIRGDVGADGVEDLQEGGGLLYHRPHDPGDAASAWELDADRPRRFHPRDLPPGLIQVAGHTGHKKCVEQMKPWLSPPDMTSTPGCLRTLTHLNGSVTYRRGVHPAGAGESVLYMIDAEMNHAERASEVPILELDDA